MEKTFISEITGSIKSRIPNIHELGKLDIKFTDTTFKTTFFEILNYEILDELCIFMKEQLKSHPYAVFMTPDGIFHVIETQQIITFSAEGNVHIKLVVGEDILKPVNIFYNYKTSIIKFNKNTQKYNIEFFDNKEAADLFAEVGGFYE